jgi:receptor protein-tyrosine kinase
MAAIFEELGKSSDLVIIDTPPLLVVSDAFGLLERVSGAIGVARVDQTPREAVARMAEVTRTVGARLLGMAATGGGLGHGYGYGYGYGYGAAPAAAAAPAPPVVDPPVVEASLNGKGGVPAQTPQDQLSAEGKSRPSRVSQLFRSS